MKKRGEGESKKGSRDDRMKCRGGGEAKEKEEEGKRLGEEIQG